MLTRKIMLLGEIAVGKTSLARRLVFDRFEANYKATLGVDIYSHDVDLQEAEGRDVLLMIWDIDGDLSDSIFNHIYIRGASGALVIGDATRPSTLETAMRLSDGFRGQFIGRPVVHIVNKMDLLEEGDAASGPAGLRHPDIGFYETSARSGQNVAVAFRELAQAIVQTGA